jgi:DNA polymerase III delta prime subunit
MAMENYSRYQQNIIKNFYKNRDDVSLQRAQELLTELYLTEGKKREKVWDSLFTNLERIGIPPDQIEHLKKERKPEMVAKLIEKKL